MAGDWIKMRLDLQTHPKIVRIMSATKADKFRVVGGLHAVWSVFDTHSADGRLDGYTADLLDQIVGWPGFAAAMISVGWLVPDGEEALLLPEYDEHNGKSGKRRAEDQKRKREGRKGPESVRNLSANDVDKKRTREEKRREEVKEEPKTMSEQSPDAVTFDVERRKPAKRLPIPEDEALASRLFGMILAGNPTFRKPNLPAWADDVRLMREIDGRTHADILAMFEWVRADSFWRSNVLSPAKLREKWDQLTERRKQPGAPRGEPPVNEKFNFGHLDRSGDARAMAESMKRHGITAPAADEDIEI